MYENKQKRVYNTNLTISLYIYAMNQKGTLKMLYAGLVCKLLERKNEA